MPSRPVKARASRIADIVSSVHELTSRTGCSGATRVKQMYLPDSNVLVTRYLCEQSVGEVVDFAAAAALPGAVLADRGGGSPSLSQPVVLVGPEGGWTDAERASGLPRVSFATHVLRAETAAITACAILTSIRSETVTEAT